MEKSLNRLIWEAKKSGKPVNPWAICTSSIGDKIGNTERSEWTKDQKERYERCVKDIKKKSPIKEESRINEIGGYDDPSMFSKHAGAYIDDLKVSYNNVMTTLNTLDTLRLEILDDKMRRDLEKFLKSVSEPIQELAKSIIDVEKRNIKNLRGGNPTRREGDMN